MNGEGSAQIKTGLEPWWLRFSFALLDFRFLELDMLARDGVVFLKAQLFRFGAGVFAGDIEIAGIGG